MQCINHHSIWWNDISHAMEFRDQISISTCVRACVRLCAGSRVGIHRLWKCTGQNIAACRSPCVFNAEYGKEIERPDRRQMDVYRIWLCTNTWHLALLGSALSADANVNRFETWTENSISFLLKLKINIAFERSTWARDSQEPGLWQKLKLKLAQNADFELIMLIIRLVHRRKTFDR